MDYDMTKSNHRRQNNFDVIRFIAASLVIITHSYSLTGTSELDPLSQITGGAILFSHMGVAVFFVISGYLITQSALSTKTWKGYMWRRFLRIIPGLTIVLLLCTFILGPLVSNLSVIDYFRNGNTYKHLLSVLIYVRNYNLPGVFSENPVQAVNGSLWTLAYEFSLYVGVIIALYCGLLRRRILITIVWILMLAIRVYLGNKYYIYSYSSPFVLNLNIQFVFEWSFYFISGMLFFLYKDLHKPNLKITIGLIILYFVFAFVGEFNYLRILNYIIIPYLVFYLSFIPGKLNNFGKHGDFSYGMYIYAFPIQQLLVFLSSNQISILLLVIFSIISTIPFAIASWHFIEKKSLAYKNLIN